MEEIGNLFDEDLSDFDEGAGEESYQMERLVKADERGGACPSFFGREEY